MSRLSTGINLVILRNIEHRIYKMQQCEMSTGLGCNGIDDVDFSALLCLSSVLIINVPSRPMAHLWTHRGRSLDAMSIHTQLVLQGSPSWTFTDRFHDHHDGLFESSHSLPCILETNQM